MKRRLVILVVLVAVIVLPVVLLQVVGRRAEKLATPGRGGVPAALDRDVFIVHPSLREIFPPVTARLTIRALLEDAPKDLQPITVDYPENESLFPPDIVAPTFLWHDETEADAWLLKVTFAGPPHAIHVLVPGRRPDPLPLDPTCTQEGGVNIYHETSYQSSAKGWRPEEDVWELMKKESVGKEAVVEVWGIGGVNIQRPTPNAQRPSLDVLAKGQVTIRTSEDPVGAPIFARSVPLLDTTKATDQRTTVASVPLIEWHIRNVSKPRPHLLLKDMPTCANCHSFSRDGSTMGMDVDGPGGDKGMYTVSPVKETLEVNTENIFTWSEFKHGTRPKDYKIFGFLSRVSPDGRHVVSTVNEALFMGYYPSYKFLQVFFPTMGILGIWSKETGEMFPLRGADDPAYVQSNGTWSQDGKYVYFIRSEAKDPYVPGAPMPTYADDPRELEIRYNIYRVPFNDGKGGEAEAIKGASHNEKSNFFPKISPDGKWMVFCQCRNGLLMRPDSELFIVPAEGGEARKMRCNGPSMNSWHTWSPNGKWLAFSSKRNTPYTQLFLTHIDENGNDTPAILVPDMNPPNRAVNLPEFVNIPYGSLKKIVVNAVDYQRRIEDGYANMTAGRYEAAGKDFRTALDLRPDATAAHYGYSVYHFVKGDYEEAEKELFATLKYEPDNPESRSYVALVNWDLGEVYARLGRTEEAEERFIAAVSEDYVYANVVELLETSRGKNQGLEKAEGYLKGILAKDGVGATQPSDPQREAGGLGEGEGERLVGATQPSDPQREAGGLGGGEGERLVGATQPSDPQREAGGLGGVRLALGTLYTMQGKEAMGEPLFREGLAVAPSSDAHYAFGVLLGRLGRQDEALEQYRESVRVDPNMSEARANLGALLIEKGEFKEAVVHLEVAVDIKPTDVHSHYNLGLATEALGRFEEAVEHYRKVADISPRDARVRMRIAAAHAALGRANEAAKTAEEALKLARLAGNDILAREIESQLAEYRE